MRKTLLERKIGTSVSDNGLIVPIDSLGEHIRRYSFPAIFHSSIQDEAILTKGGSLAKVRTDNRYFAITAYHVISNNNYDLTQLCLPEITPGRFVSSHAARFPASRAAEDDYDFVTFEFTDPVNEGLLSRSDWFDVTYDLNRSADFDAMLMVCLGYPSHRNFIQYDEKLYPVTPNAVWGEQIEPMIHHRRSFAPINPVAYDPIGMSGAPVFGLELREAHLHLALTGILTNASSRTFNYLPISSIEFP